MMKINNNNDVYKALLMRLKNCTSDTCIKMTNRRTGVAVTSLKDPQLLIFDASEDLIVFENRRYFPQIAAAECAWQFTGTTDASFINHHAPKLWSDFTNSDGEVTAAYGYRIAKTWGFDQIEQAVQALKLDDTSRQVWVQIWEPGHDMPNPNKKYQVLNVPCVIGFKLTVHNYKLNMHVVMRSSDAIVGLPYDVMVYHMTLAAISTALGMKPNSLSFTLLDSHYYERQADVLQHDNWMPSPRSIKLPNLTPKMIKADPEFYLSYFNHSCNNHPYAPTVQVVI